MRRRLWHQLCVLELRASMDRGSPPLVLSGSHTNPSPLNIEDVDFNTNSFDPPSERIGITSMTFSLMSQRCCETTKLLSYPTDASGDQDFPKMGHIRARPQEIAETFSTMVTQDILSYCDTTVPLHQYCSSVGLELASLCALTARWPLLSDIEDLPTGYTSSDNTLTLALDVLSREAEYLRSPQTTGWHWYFWAQWHTLGVALHEICNQTSTGESSRKSPVSFFQLIAVASQEPLAL